MLIVACIRDLSHFVSYFGIQIISSNMGLVHPAVVVFQINEGEKMAIIGDTL